MRSSWSDWVVFVVCLSLVSCGSWNGARANGIQPALDSDDLIVWVEDQLRGFDEVIPARSALRLRWETR